MSPRTARARRAAALFVAVGLAPSCAPERGPELQGERTILSLGDLAERVEVVRAPEGTEVRARTITPLPNSRIDAGTLPALEMRPPCEVRIAVPPTEAGARLDVALGLDGTAFQSGGVGRVHFELELDGQPRIDEWIDCNAELGRDERAWRRSHVPIEAGGTLVLRTDLEGTFPEPPLAGFGLLRVVAPFTVRRTRAARARPNVVLILVDTLRADGLHCLGNPREVSPALDDIARRGTLFERAFSPAPWTWPSTASLFTSLHPTEHGFQGLSSCYLADQHLTLAERFLEEGVATAAFTSNNLVSESKGFAQGFETFRMYEWSPASGLLPDVEAWLDEAAPWRFFLYLHFVDPHFPYEPEADMAERFVSEPPEGYGVKGVLGKELEDLQHGRPYDENLLAGHMRYALETYDGEVATVDRWIGRLTAKLAELDLTDTTVIAVTSDHGEEFLEHRMLAHGPQLFDESVHVPLLIAGPGVPAGARVRTTAEMRYLAPTLLELAGIEPRKNLRGANLLEARPPGEPLYFSTELGKWIEDPPDGAVGVGTILGVEVDGLRLHWAPRGEGDEDDLFALYDLERDPQMQVDVSRARPDDVARLRGLLAAWAEHGRSVRARILAGDDATQAELERLGYVGGD